MSANALADTGAPLLAVEHLRLAVAGRTLAADLSFAVRRGELWCVLGANGAGKTLLLHTLAGLRPLDGGAVMLAGAPLSRWRPHDAARLRGFLPQFNAHPFPMTVTEAVVMGRHPHLPRWAWEGEDDLAHARAAIDEVGLAALAGRDVTTLSGGERQRVSIATLFAQEAPLMLLDEPVAHLDLRHQIGVLDHLARRARDGCGVVLSIHDLTLARGCATHALLLRGGGRATAGPIEDVMTDAALTDAFACPIARIDAGGRAVYVAG